MNRFNYFIRIIDRIRKNLFIKNFEKFDKSSFIGKNGYGDTCKIVGEDRISIGKNTNIGYDSEFFVYESHFSKKLNSHLTIGDNVRIQCRIRVTCAGNVSIGNNVLIAPDVFITDHNHGMNPTIDGGYSPQELMIRDVVIGNGCWIGQRCSVLPGVTIGEHSIIGANSVVTKSIPPYSIAVGSPAKIIKIWNFEKSEWEKIE